MMSDVPKGFSMLFLPLPNAITFAIVSISILVDFIYCRKIEYSDDTFISSSENDLGIGIVGSCY